jgi:GT2 family glycosyltransferase
VIKEIPALGILILNRNGKEWLSPLYDSIKVCGYREVRVYLVDNASDDGSVKMTLDKYPEVTVIQMPQNLGYCMAYNLAIPYAFTDGCDWVIWANSDIKLEPGCLSELARIAQSDPRIGILGPGFLAWDSDEPNYYIVGNYPYTIPAIKSQSGEPIDVEWVEGSFLMVSRRCVEAVGPLDPYLFFYWEETDFCRRARHQGWRVVLVPSALARHYARGSTNQQNRALVNMFQSRNYYIYKLTNPFQSFVQNLKEAVHLFLVKLKANRCSFPSSLIAEIRVFGKVLSDIRNIHEKWVRDRKGDKPPFTTRDFQSFHIEVIRNSNASSIEGNLSLP